MDFNQSDFLTAMDIKNLKELIFSWKFEAEQFHGKLTHIRRIIHVLFQIGI